METESMKSEEIHKEGHKAERDLNVGNFKNETEKLRLKTRIKMNRSLDIMENVGLLFHMASAPDPHALAWVYKDKPDGFVSMHTLLTKTDYELTHIAHHEKGHKLTGIYAIDLQANLHHEQIAALEEELKITNLPGINLMEGLNERRTILAKGKDYNIAYLYLEVPVVYELELLTRKYAKGSLQEKFNTGDQQGVFDLLKILANQLLVRKEVKKIVPEVNKIMPAAKFDKNLN